MKKIVTIAAVALLGTIVLPSCKKDYTCVCTVSSGGTSISNEYSLGKQTKKDAKNACEQKATSSNGVTAKCELK